MAKPQMKRKSEFKLAELLPLASQQEEEEGDVGALGALCGGGKGEGEGKNGRMKGKEGRKEKGEKERGEDSK